MNTNADRTILFCAAAFLIAAGCGGSSKENASPVSASSSEANKEGASAARDGISRGKLFRFESQADSPLRRPEPGTEDLANPDARQRLLESRAPGNQIAASFQGTASILFSMLNIPIFCFQDEVCAKKIGSPFPDFYRPTWREYFNAIARSTGTHWSFTEAWRDAYVLVTRQADGTETTTEQRDGFLFEAPPLPLPFSIEIAEGWQMSPRGDYVSYVPSNASVGMDVYIGGEYSPDDAELYKKVREHWAMQFASRFDTAVAVADMKTDRVGDVEALYYEYEHTDPRKAFRWRQWSFVKNGFCFVIVSVIDAGNEATNWPDVSRMVASFQVL